MADLAILTTRLLRRLPERTSGEAEGWLDEAAIPHGYQSVAKVPDRQANALLAYAVYLGIKIKAAETAENASINLDGRISVNKSGASGNYTALLKDAFAEYRREAARVGLRAVTGGTANMISVSRADGR